MLFWDGMTIQSPKSVMDLFFNIFVSFLIHFHFNFGEHSQIVYKRFRHACYSLVSDAVCYKNLSWAFSPSPWILKVDIANEEWIWQYYQRHYIFIACQLVLIIYNNNHNLQTEILCFIQNDLKLMTEPIMSSGMFFWWSIA